MFLNKCHKQSEQECNNVLKFLFEIVNKFQVRNVPLFQYRHVILLSISSAVLYSVLKLDYVPEQKCNDLQTDVVVTIPRPSCTKVSDKVHHATLNQPEKYRLGGRFNIR